MNDFENLPIYIKAHQIFELTAALSTTIPDDEGKNGLTAHYMIDYAATIQMKIENAEEIKRYDVRMENAAFIRSAAIDLLEHAVMLLPYTECSDYAQLLQKEIDEFRLMFITWVRSFDRTNYIVDNWGLFNPPGVEPKL